MTPRRRGESQNEATAPVPLVVDVDGTLVSSDLLVEGIVRHVVASPFGLLALPFWLLRGRAALKRWIARSVPLLPSSLPLNPAVVDEIEAAKVAGREVWLASAADAQAIAPLAEAVGAAGAFASDGRTNLSGRAKAEVLVAKFGEGGFEYIGNEWRDLAVWRHAVPGGVIGANVSAALARRLQALDERARLLPGPRGNAMDYVRALRPHQWVKNVLVFLPLIAAHETHPELYLVAAGVFVALSACASATYLCNDLLDLPYDRAHSSKHHRPLAAGKIRALPSVGVGVGLAAGGLALAFWLSMAAGMSVLFYLLAGAVYTLLLKRKIYIDVVVLTVLYAVRIVAGAVAVSVALSPWFLGFFLFVFLCLGAVKRLQELSSRCDEDRGQGGQIGGRDYRADDRQAMTAIAASSGVAAVVVHALYVQSANVHALYARPELLWLMAPFLLYWLGRMTLLANRGATRDDPVEFVLRDRSSWATGLCIVAVFVAALWA